ncbi:MAG: DUF5674 family protein [Fibrobacterota bacterium]|nr:DUF5674 family protein [Fibrobacterota bacterium]
MLEQGSRQEALWGINLYPGFSKSDDNFVEFDAMINLKPAFQNLSRSVENPELQKAIIRIVGDWVL